jgi:hypothetical protein
MAEHKIDQQYHGIPRLIHQVRSRLGPFGAKRTYFRRFPYLQPVFPKGTQREQALRTSLRIHSQVNADRKPTFGYRIKFLIFINALIFGGFHIFSLFVIG